MTLAIERLERPGIGPAEVAAFLAEHEFPIVEGSMVTFVYAGAASSVRLHHWVFGLASSRPFARLRGSDLWFLVMDIPEGSRVEYKLEVARGSRRELTRDPLNPHLAHDPFGANSVVHAAGYVEPEWARADPDARRGEIVDFEIGSAAFGMPRPVQVYLPARFRPRRRYPLLVVHDGPDYLRYSRLQTVLDNLIHRLEVHAMVVALIRPGDRLVEYADDRRHASFLVDDLVPALEERYPLVPGPEGRGLMGASFGAVASLAAAWRHPGVFGQLLLQSGSFVFTDIGEHDRGPAFDRVVEFVNAFRKQPGKPAQSVYMSCGTYESNIYYNRSMLPLLQSTGMRVRYGEARDGHNWENWRDRLREGLSWLVPGPLWMVYE